MSAPKVGTDEFAIINERVKVMSKKEAEAFFYDSHLPEVLGWYERGAILHHGLNVWFDKNHVQHSKWVLETLRIPDDQAKRLIRVYLAVLHSGLTSEDFRGIPISSVLPMLPILRHGKSDAKYRKAMPELLDLARTGTVKEVKALCYDIRGMTPPADREKRQRTEFVASMQRFLADLENGPVLDQAHELLKAIAGVVVRYDGDMAWVIRVHAHATDGTTFRFAKVWEDASRPPLYERLKDLGVLKDEDDDPQNRLGFDSEESDESLRDPQPLESAPEAEDPDQHQTLSDYVEAVAAEEGLTEEASA